jgi:hypothetical protein
MVLVLESAALFLILTGASCDFSVLLMGFSSLGFFASRLSWSHPYSVRLLILTRMVAISVVLRATMFLDWFYFLNPRPRPSPSPFGFLLC